MSSHAKAAVKNQPVDSSQPAEKKRSIVFGTTQPRPLIPTTLPRNWTATTCYFSPIALGPGSYDVKPWTESCPPRPVKDPVRHHQRRKRHVKPVYSAAWESIGSGPSSVKERGPSESPGESLSPKAKTEVSRPHPFGSGQERLTKLQSYCPGPGTYNEKQDIGRRVAYPQSLGSKPIIQYEKHDDRSFIKNLSANAVKKICQKAHYLKLYE